jgi:hypothetical protein
VEKRSLGRISYLDTEHDSSVLIACGRAARGTNYLDTAGGLGFVRCAMMDDIRQQTGKKKMSITKICNRNTSKI